MEGGPKEAPSWRPSSTSLRDIEEGRTAGRPDGIRPSETAVVDDPLFFFFLLANRRQEVWLRQYLSRRNAASKGGESLAMEDRIFKVRKEAIIPRTRQRFLASALTAVPPSFEAASAA
jgi:hypothetical protein